MFLYDRPRDDVALSSGVPKLPLLRDNAPTYRYSSQTVGDWYEKNLADFEAMPYIDVDQNAIDVKAVLSVYCKLFPNASNLPDANRPAVVAIYYFSKLADALPDTVDALQYAEFENKYQDLLGLVRYFRDLDERTIPASLQEFVPQDELIDHFDEVLFSCKLGAMRALHDEYLRRVRDVKQKQFLSYFLQRHPGIQHKAGVPMGGTFILVYHESPKRLVVKLPNVRPEAILARSPLAGSSAAARLAGTSAAGSSAAEAAATETPFVEISASAPPAPEATPLEGAINRLLTDRSVIQNRDVQLIIGQLTGQVPSADFLPRLGSDVDRIVSAAVNELADGTVIADFFLPYRCCDGCSSVQFTLPAERPTFTWSIGCTNPKSRVALVTLTPEGGSSPYAVKVDGQSYVPLAGALQLKAGSHAVTIKDGAGNESEQQTIGVADPITFGAPTFQELEGGQYQVVSVVSGGQPPYDVADPKMGAIDQNTNTFTSRPQKRGVSAVDVVVTDSNKCQAKQSFRRG
jgi:hypothetical protein